MRWKRAVNPVRRARVDDLRYVAGDSAFAKRLLFIELVNYAMDQMQAGRFAEATGTLREAVSIQPEAQKLTEGPDRLHISALSLLGQAYQQLGRREDAEGCFSALLDVYEQHAPLRAEDRPTTLTVAESLALLARSRELQGAPEEAMTLALRSRALYRECAGGEAGVDEEARAVERMIERLSSPR